MSLTKYSRGLLVSGAIAAVVAALASGGCSSSSSGPTDAGDETPIVSPIHRLEASTGTESGGSSSGGDGSSSGQTFDKTTGRACTSNAECVGDGGPGTNVCSNTYTQTPLFAVPSAPAPGVTPVTIQIWPTPVCIMQIPAAGGNCDPGPAGATQFCDSPNPLDLNAPGICVPITNPQAAGPTNGLCFPACHYPLDGVTKPIGCAGNNTCAALFFNLDQQGGISAYGICQGSCQSDADCALLGSGFGCQQDLGFCTNTKKTRTKPIGTSCTNMAVNQSTTDTANATCNCFSLSTVTAGYCTSACVVGGTPCPNGWVCEAFEPKSLNFTNSATGADAGTFPGPTAQNPGLPGTCMPPCALADAGAPEAGSSGEGGAAAGEGGTSDAAVLAACPPLSSCIDLTVAGPDCQPM